MNEPSQFRCGTITIIGRPNVGKSTLLNCLIGTKLSITSRKAQTTRHRILGIHTRQDAQFIFLDTPGFQQNYQNALNKKLNKTALQTFADADIILFVVEPNFFCEDDLIILKKLPRDQKVFLLINKIDQIKDKNMLLPRIEEHIRHSKFTFTEVLFTSCRKQASPSHLLDTLQNYLPCQPPVYEEDEFTDRSERFLAAELLREKVFRTLGQDVPYQIMVTIESFQTKDDFRRIEAVFWVNKASQKSILIGSKGGKLKQIATTARIDMEKLFGGKIWLNTWVKVKKDWINDEKILTENF